MNLKISDLMKETKEPFSRGYWKITITSFLMVLLSTGVSYSSLIGSVNQIPELLSDVISQEIGGSGPVDIKMIAILLTMVGGLLLLSLLVKLLLDVLLENPLEVGADRMMIIAMEGEKPVMLASLAHAFDANYIGTVKAMFLKRFFKDMWLLLFIVPGIIKGYEYMMIPYLLAENPYQSSKDLFAKSKAMMKGNKLQAFKIDLYFIPLRILGLITLGLMNIFYVEPKKNLVMANFYLKIKEQNKGGEE